MLQTKEFLASYTGFVRCVERTKRFRGDALGVTIPAQFGRPRTVGKIFNAVMKIEQHDNSPMCEGSTQTHFAEAVK